MKTTTQTEERRQDSRFKIQGMVIAVARPPSIPPGTVKEISQGGLVFQYRENGNSWMIPQELDIIWADYVATHHMEKMPVRIVSDVLIEKEENGNKPTTRQQTVTFETLSPRQENQLGRLIKARGTISL
jgi:c-di-GMP-binding flagellar brake protein YcgR